MIHLFGHTRILIYTQSNSSVFSAIFILSPFAMDRTYMGKGISTTCALVEPFLLHNAAEYQISRQALTWRESYLLTCRIFLHIQRIGPCFYGSNGLPAIEQLAFDDLNIVCNADLQFLDSITKLASSRSCKENNLLSGKIMAL